MTSDEETGCLGLALGYIGLVLAITLGWNQIIALLQRTPELALIIYIAGFLGMIFMANYFVVEAEHEEWPIRLAAFFVGALPMVLLIIYFGKMPTPTPH